MTLSISITIADDVDPRLYLEAQMAALGFCRAPAPSREPNSIEGIRRAIESTTHERAPAPVTEMVAETLAEVMTEAESGEAASPAVKRERGKPSPGRQRHSRQEVEEDEAAEAAEAAQRAGVEPAAPEPVIEEPPAPVQQISAGEERIDPAADPEPPAADIFAEPAPPAEPKTLEDVKRALGAYVTAFGMAAAQTDGQLIFREVLGAPPAGETAWRMTLIPADGGKFDAVVAAIERAIAVNPYKRERIA